MCHMNFFTKLKKYYWYSRGGVSWEGCPFLVRVDVGGGGVKKARKWVDVLCTRSLLQNFPKNPKENSKTQAKRLKVSAKTEKPDLPKIDIKEPQVLYSDFELILNSKLGLIQD